MISQARCGRLLIQPAAWKVGTDLVNILTVPESTRGALLRWKELSGVVITYLGDKWVDRDPNCRPVDTSTEHCRTTSATSCDMSRTPSCWLWICRQQQQQHQSPLMTVMRMRMRSTQTTPAAHITSLVHLHIAIITTRNKTRWSSVECIPPLRHTETGTVSLPRRAAGACD